MIKKRISLVFPATVVNRPIVSEMIKKSNVDVNILHADIGINKKGRLILEISGTQEEDINLAFKLLEQNNVSITLFDKSILKDEEKCVHCGACVGVCPSEALFIDKSDASIQFDKQKCIVCGFCVKSCPLNVIKVEGDLTNV